MHRVLRVVAIVVAGLAATSSAFAQGFGVYEQGACAMGRGGTGVASPCEDGSAVFFNPAGVAIGRRQQIGFGATLIRPSGDFVNDTDRPGMVSRLKDATYPVPSLYFARRVNNRIGFGFGLFAPYGLTSEWPNDSEGRFLGYKTVLQGIYLQPTVAYNLNDTVAFGAGLNITHVKLELHRRADLAAVAIPGTPYTFGNLGVPAATDFADVFLNGDAWSMGYHLGALVKLHERVSLGARFLSGQTVDVTTGSVDYTQILTGQTLKVPLPGLPVGTPIDAVVAPQFSAGGKLSDQSATTSIALPAQAVLGTAFQLTSAAKLLVDYQFVRWSRFDELVVDQEVGDTLALEENYRNTHGIRFGFEHALGEASVIRAGFLAHPAAAPDETVTPLLPEGPRREVTVGIGTALGGLRVDLAYQYLHQADRRGRTREGENNGVYRFRGHLFGITFGF